MAQFTAIFEHATWSPEHGFNSVWEGTGRRWNFSAAASDQGALYYLFKLQNAHAPGALLDPFSYGY